MADRHIFPFLWMRGEDEAILRNEIEKICACGIRAICVEARPHDDFCGPGWWHDMDIVIDEARRRNLQIWILDDRHFPTGYANGLIEKKYPERRKLYLAHATADIYGGRHQRTLNVRRMLKPSIGYWQIGQPVDEEERARNRLYAIVAARQLEGDVFDEDAIDLTDAFDGTYATFTLPEGQWRVFVLYLTRTDGGDDAYINMIDSASAATQLEGVYEAHYERYADEFGKTIAGFFSDEPQLGNVVLHDQWDAQVGRMKMQLLWSDELEAELKRKYGNRLPAALPFLFVETCQRNLRDRIRYDYMDQVSRLYRRNFSDRIGAWCAAHGVEYIGHVVEDNGLHSRMGMGAAHYFRAMSGQHMAGVDCIGGQVVYGAPNLRRKGMTEQDGEFFHYALGKLGASCGHLDPRKKGRVMCELFGAYGWNFGVRDMKYLLDHLLVKGVNYLVPHAFSMAEYPDPDCPPHFYARGNNPEFPHFATLMKYADQMCRLLSGGRHVASVAVLYDAEADWLGDNMPMQKVIRPLLQNQIDLDIVCLDMLDDLAAYGGKCEDGLLSVNGVDFGALIVGHSPTIPEKLARFAVRARAAGLPVIFADGLPDAIVGAASDGISIGDALAACEAVPLDELAPRVRALGLTDVAVDPPCAELSAYHYCAGRHIFLFLNESPSRAYRGVALLPIEGPVAHYDAMADRYEAADCEQTEGGVRLPLELEPGQCAVIVERSGEACARRHESFRQQLSGLAPMDISDHWNVSMAKAGAHPVFSEATVQRALSPISDALPDFSGVIRYERTVCLDRAPNKAVLRAEHVYEVMKVVVNGQEAAQCIFPPYQVEIGRHLRQGENAITIEVATTPARDVLRYPQPPFDFSYEALEPTGMFGRVELFLEPFANS